MTEPRATFPRLQAAIEHHKHELPYDTYKRYSRLGIFPKVLHFIATHTDLVEAYCADAREKAGQQPASQS